MTQPEEDDRALLGMVRDIYLFPFLLVGNFNAPAWVDNDDRAHRRAMNRLNGALILGVLNVWVLIEIWPRPLPDAGGLTLWLSTAAFLAPFAYFLAGDRGEQRLARWGGSSLFRKVLIGGLGLTLYAIPVTVLLRSAPG